MKKKCQIGEKLYFLEIQKRISLRIKSQFTALFNGDRISDKPVANLYKQFSRQWGWRKTLFELANEDYTKIKEIEQSYVTDVLVYLTYLKDKAIAEKAQNEMDEQIRKQKRGGNRK